MNTNTHIKAATIALATLAGTTLAGGGLVVNGGFETGDFSGWETLDTGDSIFQVVSDSASGAWAANFRNDDEASGALLKQTGIGLGTVQAGDLLNISFDGKGGAGIGGVFFAELFSVNAAGGVTQSEILGGAPIFFSDTYQNYSFDTVAGPDVAGGLTIQFGAITGAEPGSFSEAFIDNVVITIVPAPASMALLGFGGLVATRRHR